MSSPINLSEDVDPALKYAPRWVRERATQATQRSLAPVRTPPAQARNVAKFRPSFSGDRAMLDLQRQLALNPDIIPEPSPEDASVVWPILIRLCAVTGLAAVLAWGIVTLPAMKKATQMARPEIPTSSASLPAGTTVFSHVKFVHIEQPADAPQPVEDLATANAAPPVATAAVNPESAQPTIAAAPPQSAPPELTPPQQSEQSGLRLDDAEVATLIERGKEFLDNGDLASARLLLRRAADGGSAEAALALATTFDPVVLRRLGAIGAQPDLAKAREWYQRAVDLGSSAASQQLAKLAADQ
jgi:hypothetical protein